VIDIERDFCFLDLSLEDHAQKAFAGATIVFHLADVVAGIGYVFEHEHWIYRQNSKINGNVVDAVFNSSTVTSYVFVGTACSFPRELQSGYGVTKLHENQTYPADPESAYGWSKLMGEYEAELMLKASSKRNLNVGVLRFHNVYGPRGEYADTTRSQALPSLIRKAILSPHEEFVVWGSGKQYRDFVYVSDAVAAIVAFLERGMNMGVIQVGTGLPTTLLDAAKSIQELTSLCLNKTIAVQLDSTKRDGDLGRVAVLQKARDVLNWTSKVAFDEGIARTYTWILNDIRTSNFHTHHEEGAECLESQAAKSARSDPLLGKLLEVNSVPLSQGLQAWMPPKLHLEDYIGPFSCDHNKTLPPSSIVTQNSVLVIVIASTRARHISFPMFQEYVLNVLPCDLALSLATTTANGDFDSFRKAAKYIWEIEEPASNSLSGPPNYRHYYDDIARVCFGGRFTAEDAKIIGQDFPNQWLGLITETDHPAGSGMLIFYRWLVLVKMEELNLFAVYKHVVITRSDYYYIQPHPPVSGLLPGHIMVPLGETYGGKVTDRHTVFHIDDARRVLGLAEIIGSGSAARTKQLLDMIGLPERAQRAHLNLEGVLTKWYANLSLEIENFPPVAFTVRDKDDESPNRWVFADKANWVESKVIPKYASEYQLALNAKKKSGK